MKVLVTEQQIRLIIEQIEHPFAGTEKKFQQFAPELEKLGKLFGGAFPTAQQQTNTKEPQPSVSRTKNNFAKHIPSGNQPMHPLGKKMPISSSFGKRNIPTGSSDHKGVDISTPSGSLVYSPLDGVVVAARDTTPNGCGGFIKIEHQNTITKFCHLKQFAVKEGDQVKKGQIVGYSGGGRNDPMKGVASGPHLHYEVIDKVSGIAMNPITANRNLA